ncbi:unnamed protein product [Staurois parvus]|uniref:Uncharacterized protein n=1 Tax=Staurois parvus TaxID=386267 RepID=A0ABN9F2B8_9NEOB|nr:unnamed protein product [Staurois parvus]
MLQPLYFLMSNIIAQLSAGTEVITSLLYLPAVDGAKIGQFFFTVGGKVSRLNN